MAKPKVKLLLKKEKDGVLVYYSGSVEQAVNTINRLYKKVLAKKNDLIGFPEPLVCRQEFHSSGFRNKDVDSIRALRDLCSQLANKMVLLKSSQADTFLHAKLMMTESLTKDKK